MPSEHSWTSIGAEDEDLLEGGVAGSAAEERAYFKSLYERRKGIRNKGGDQRNKFIKIASLGILTLLLIFNVYFHNHDGKISDIFNFSKSTTDIANTGGIESSKETDDAMSMLSGQSNDDGLLYEKPESDINGIKPKRIERISILGERNTKETDLIVNLMNCFPDLEISTSLNRLGHWFQDESLDTAAKKPTIVIALFLNIYDWVDLMRYNPLNAPMHEGLDWRRFVTTPWAMERPESDLKMLSKKSDNMCQWEFSYDEVIPCFSSMDSMEDPVYELKRDGSGSPFDSIVNLRAEKIRNYLSTSKYPYVQKVMPVKYEDLIKQGGLDELVQAIMRESNIPSKCDLGNMSLKPPRDKFSPAEKYVEWLDNNAEWDAEKLIGYEKGEMIKYENFNIYKSVHESQNFNGYSEKEDELWSGPINDDFSSFEIVDKSESTESSNSWMHDEPSKSETFESGYNDKEDGSNVEYKPNPDENWYNQDSTDKNQAYGSSTESKSNNEISVKSSNLNEEQWFEKTSSSGNLQNDIKKPSEVTDNEEDSMINSIVDEFLSEFTSDTNDELTNTIEINKPKVISLLAERNTGLEWLHPKIKNCFPDLAVTTTLTRESPWFQTPPDANQLEPTLAIALFMNPFTWIELMRMNAVHSPNHVNKDWFSFVMAPWTMDRPADDTQVTKCQYEFSYDEVIPCGTIRTDSGDHAVYEMKCREGKCEPYKNIIGLRADKIGNFLSVANWKNVVFMSINYESLTKSTGFSYLLSQIEEKTGAKALCKEEELKAPVPPSKLTGGEKEEFRTWIKDNLNWAPEYDIGYGNTMDEDVWG